MEKRGFPAQDYLWDEPRINEHLQQALAYRPSAVGYTVGGNVVAGSGVVLSSAGLIEIMVGSIVNSLNLSGTDENPDRYGVMMGVGLGATVGGVVMIVQGAKRGRWARSELRLMSYTNRAILIKGVNTGVEIEPDLPG